MITPQAAVAAVQPGVFLGSAPPADDPPEHEISFRDVLSALNPLQYLPGVGTIYRAMTGDRPPEAVRAIGSMIVGGLLGGPIGVAISAVSAFMQHVTGIDMDNVAHDVLASVGLVDKTPAAVTVATPPPAALPPPAAPATLARSATAAEAPLYLAHEQSVCANDAVLPRLALAAYGRALGRV